MNTNKNVVPIQTNGNTITESMFQEKEKEIEQAFNELKTKEAQLLQSVESIRTELLRLQGEYRFVRRILDGEKEAVANEFDRSSS